VKRFLLSDAFARASDAFHTIWAELAFPALTVLAFCVWNHVRTMGAAGSMLMVPSLLPMILIKPQIALPLVLVGKINRTGVLATLTLLAVSLLFYPSWPWVWLRQLHGYQGFSPPLFSLPLGPLLFLVLFRWREKRS
jgi:hypothetical protein